MSDTRTAAMYRCNLCGFVAPADPVGEALMRQHLREEHDE